MNDDLIRRSDAYKAIDDWLAGRVPNLNIKDIPSADRPQGEWIDVNGDGSLWRCDQCKDTACCKGNYCSNCGARMKGADNE